MQVGKLETRFDIDGDFAADGAVCVRGAFKEHLGVVESAIEAILASPSARFVRASADSDSAFVEDFCNWWRISDLHRFLLDSPAAALAAMLTGSSQIRLYHDHVLVKEPYTRQATRWHQDLPFYNLNGSMNASMWLPVDPVGGPTTLQFIAGSHLGAWYLPRTFLHAAARWFPPGRLAEVPDFDSAPKDWRRLSWSLEPGDAVFFHMLTVHSSGGNPKPHQRRALSLRFLGDDMVHAPRPWPTSPPFPGLSAALEPGAPMEHPLFPRLWPDDQGSNLAHSAKTWSAIDAKSGTR